jgi:signal transduction histidine kinase
LLHNALRHTPPGGLIIVNTRVVNESVCIEVADSGEGISPEDLPHIWEKFYTRSGGAGLGLALVKELCEAMGGMVGVESRSGHGSMFWVKLPGETATELRHD